MRSSLAALGLRALCVCALSSTTALAAGWTQPEGAYYVKIWNRALMGQGAFTADGDIEGLPDSFTDMTLNVYGEYGLTDTLSLVVFATPAGRSTFGDEAATYMGAVNGGLRKGWTVGKTKIAIEGQYGYAPAFGDEALATGVTDDTAEPFVYVPTINTHRLSAELQIGRPLSFGWFSVSGGYRYLSASALDPQIFGFGQIGWSFSPKLELDFHASLLEALGDIEMTEVLGVGQTRYLGLGLGANWWLTPGFAINAGLDGAVYAASNAAAVSVAMGVALR